MTDTAQKPTFYALPFDPARFADLPEVEDVGASTVPGEVCLSLTTGEEVSTPPHALTVYEAPDGQPFAAELDGAAYRLPADFAHLFAWGMSDPKRAETSSALRGAAYHLAHVTAYPTAEDAAHRLGLALHFLEDAAQSWPGEEGTARHD